MADDDSSELSSISSLSEPPSDIESEIQLEEERQGIRKFFPKVDRNPALEPKDKTPLRHKREPSPPHEYVLADNPDIAVRVYASVHVFAGLRRERSRLQLGRGYKLTAMLAVHCYVPRPVQRSVSQESSEFRSPGARARCGRDDSGRARRALSVRPAKPASEP